MQAISPGLQQLCKISQDELIIGELISVVGGGGGGGDGSISRGEEKWGLTVV